MLGFNDYIPTYVYTQRGIIEINKAVSGDTVIEYKTNRKLKVLDVIHTDSQNIYQVDYTDGRSEIYTENDLILDGKDIVKIIDILTKTKFNEIDQFPVEFKFRNIVPKLDPDPNVAGALIIHGNYDTPYLNLPVRRSGVDQLLSHKYHLDFCDMTDPELSFYAFNGADEKDRITWKEFFPNYDFYVTSRRTISPLIPVEYTQGSIIDRRKFIRGVFDIGYYPEFFPTTIGISNAVYGRLGEIQKMLWSLGISSLISHDPYLLSKTGMEYRLDVMLPCESTPGFFYHIYNLLSCFPISNRCNVELNRSAFRIKSIGKVCTCGCTIERGFMTNLVLEKPNALYMTENFIPRISV